MADERGRFESNLIFAQNKLSDRLYIVYGRLSAMPFLCDKEHEQCHAVFEQLAGHVFTEEKAGTRHSFVMAIYYMRLPESNT